MKSIIAAGILLGASAPAIAGPYANVENNASFLGSDFGASLTEVHVGYEFDNGVYVQGGPAYSVVEGGEGASEYSGKAGVSVPVSERVDVYGEVSFITTDKEFEFEELNVGTKVGATFRF